MIRIRIVLGTPFPSFIINITQFSYSLIIDFYFKLNKIFENKNGPSPPSTKIPRKCLGIGYVRLPGNSVLPQGECLEEVVFWPCRISFDVRAGVDIRVHFSRTHWQPRLLECHLVRLQHRPQP